jgi:hypothetical protein
MKRMLNVEFLLDQLTQYVRRSHQTEATPELVSNAEIVKGESSSLNSIEEV